MALQIRRGLEADRLAVTPKSGEFIYSEDEKKVFIGDGVTPGGISLTSVNSFDKIAVAGQGLVQALSSSETLTLEAGDSISIVTDPNTNKIRINAILGAIRGDINGSVFADDSTLLVDAVNGRIVGPVFANVTGDVTGTVSSLSNHTTDDLVEGAQLYYTDTRARDAFSGGTGVSYAPLTGQISIGQSVATTADVTFATVSSRFTGPLTGDVNGSIFADNSTLLVDAVNGKIVGPVFANVTGDVTGNVTGNVTGTVSSLSNHTTDNLSEGVSNQYFTTEKTRAAISGGDGISYDTNTGVISLGSGGTVSITNLVATNLVGHLTGDVNGSIFADNSSLLVDAINNKFYGTLYGDVNGNTYGIHEGSVRTNNIASEDSTTIFVNNRALFRDDTQVLGQLASINDSLFSGTFRYSDLSGSFDLVFINQQSVQFNAMPVQFGRFSSAQRDQLVAAGRVGNGTVIYNNELHKFQGWANGTWVDLN